MDLIQIKVCVAKPFQQGLDLPPGLITQYLDQHRGFKSDKELSHSFEHQRLKSFDIDLEQIEPRNPFFVEIGLEAPNLHLFFGHSPRKPVEMCLVKRSRIRMFGDRQMNDGLAVL